MFIYEYKVNPKPRQIIAINEAIRTSQFVRNKVLRFWMDNRGIGKTEMFRYNTLLRKEFKFVEDLNSHACQTAVERVLRAINRFYDNCKKHVKGRHLCGGIIPPQNAAKKGYPKFKKNTRSVEYKVSGWKLSENKKTYCFHRQERNRDSETDRETRLKLLSNCLVVTQVVRVEGSPNNCIQTNAFSGGIPKAKETGESNGRYYVWVML